MERMHEALSCLGALALECRPARAAGQPALAAAEAGDLAALVARDLATLAPEAARLDLALIAGLFDPVELLRPGWPLHAELERLIAQAPARGEARVIAFGARAGVLPEPLRPNPDYADGPLRLLPFVLRGDAAVVAAVGQRFEESLLETGMAGADTALLAQERFGVAVEHARYLTYFDLAAMMLLQYEHAGLAALWPLVESALFAADEAAWLDAPPEPLLLWRDGEVRVARFDQAAWRAQGFAPGSRNGDNDARAFDRFLMRQNQLAAVLRGHGLRLRDVDCRDAADPREILRSPPP
jgi:hypothetical protein